MELPCVPGLTKTYGNTLNPKSPDLTGNRDTSGVVPPLPRVAVEVAVGGPHHWYLGFPQIPGKSKMQEYSGTNRLFVYPTQALCSRARVPRRRSGTACCGDQTCARAFRRQQRRPQERFHQHRLPGGGLGVMVLLLLAIQH